MNTFLLVLHLVVTLALIGTVLIQRSEGGGLGIGTSQGMGSFMTGRGTANLLTRTTAVLAAIFMLLSLALAVLNRGGSGGRDILGAAPPAATRPLARLPAAPAAPATPAKAPLADTPSASTPQAKAPAATPPATNPSGATPLGAKAPPAPAKPVGPSVPTQ